MRDFWQVCVAFGLKMRQVCEDPATIKGFILNP